MKDHIYIKGRKYISTKEASGVTGYVSDYVGQLSRLGKIRTTMVGHTRYIDEEDILNYGGSDSVYFEGNKYISTKKASEITGYSSDYVGQLSRRGAIKSTLVSNTRFVDENEILEYARIYKKEPPAFSELESEKFESKIFLEKEKSDLDVVDKIKKIFKKEPSERITEIDYLEDRAPLIPSLRKKFFDESDKTGKPLPSPFTKHQPFVSDAFFKKILSLVIAVSATIGPYVFYKSPYAGAAYDGATKVVQTIKFVGSEIAEMVKEKGSIILITDSVIYTKDFVKDFLKTEAEKILAQAIKSLPDEIKNVGAGKTAGGKIATFDDLAEGIYNAINSIFGIGKEKTAARYLAEQEKGEAEKIISEEKEKTTEKSTITRNKMRLLMKKALSDLPAGEIKVYGQGAMPVAGLRGADPAQVKTVAGLLQWM